MQSYTTHRITQALVPVLADYPDLVAPAKVFCYPSEPSHPPIEIKFIGESRVDVVVVSKSRKPILGVHAQRYKAGEVMEVLVPEHESIHVSMSRFLYKVYSIVLVV